jgi:hypothetical protein
VTSRTEGNARHRGAHDDRLVAGEEPTAIIRVCPARSPRRTAEVLRWLRWLLPAAMLVVAPAPMGLADGPEDDDLITVDADGLGSGPLSFADELVRKLRRAGRREG